MSVAIKSTWSTNGDWPDVGRRSWFVGKVEIFRATFDWDADAI